MLNSVPYEFVYWTLPPHFVALLVRRKAFVSLRMASKVPAYISLVGNLAVDGSFVMRPHRPWDPQTAVY